MNEAAGCTAGAAADACVQNKGGIERLHVGVQGLPDTAVTREASSVRLLTRKSR